MPGGGLLWALAAIMAGALAAQAVAWRAVPISRRLGLLDFPDPAGGRKLHGEVTPLVGGPALLGAFAAGLALVALSGQAPGQGRTLAWLGAAVLAMGLIGMADDRFQLSARERLLAATAVLTLAMVDDANLRLSFLLFSGQQQLVLLPGLAGLAFTLLVLVGLLNAVNMADGKNGMVLSQAMVWAAVLALRLPPPWQPAMLAVLGALVVLFCHNMAGRLFLGDGGSYALSALFGLMAVLAWNQGFESMRADAMVLLFALPVLDTLRLMGHRLLSGKSPFTPGRDHLHHYLFDRWGWPSPLVWVVALVAVPNVVALVRPDATPAMLALTLLGYCGLIALARRRPAGAPAG